MKAKLIQLTKCKREEQGLTQQEIFKKYAKNNTCFNIFCIRRVFSKNDGRTDFENIALVQKL
jgi:hypothetical protein